MKYEGPTAEDIRRLIPLEPSAIDRLAALVDEDAAERVRRDDWVRERARNLKPLPDHFMSRVTIANL